MSQRTRYAAWFAVERGGRLHPTGHGDADVRQSHNVNAIIDRVVAERHLSARTCRPCVDRGPDGTDESAARTDDGETSRRRGPSTVRQTVRIIYNNTYDVMTHSRLHGRDVRIFFFFFLGRRESNRSPHETHETSMRFPGQICRKNALRGH